MKKLSLALLVFLLAVGAAAQVRYGSVEGTVKDQGGQALPGVTITLSGEAMMGQRVAVSDENGRFRFALAPPGNYSVEAALVGFQTVMQESVPVSLGQTAILDITMASGTFAETLEVTADQILIDTTNSQVGGNLVGDFVATLANDRQYQMVMAMLPGGIEANNPYMHGAAGADNMYLVDGADNSDPMTRTWSTAMNFDNLDEIQVVTGGASAEYGKGTGAVVNLVTKSGSNEFHGLFRYTYSDEDLNSELRGDRYYFRDATKYVGEKRPAANLGGPIAKDKLWFFASYEQRDKSIPFARYDTIEDAIALQRTSGNAPYQGHYLSGKLTLQPTPEHTIFAMYSEDPIDIPLLYAYSGYQDRAPEADSFRFQGGWNGLLDWTGVLSANTFLDFKYNMKRNELNNDVIGTGTTYYSPAGGGIYWNATPSIYLTNRYHDIYSLALNHFIDAAGGGHELKVGVEFADIDLTYRSDSYPGGEYIRYKNDGVTPDYRYLYLQWRGVIPYTNESWTVYAQDSWQLSPNFTLNLGVRVENMQEKNNEGTSILDWGWGDRIQPRLGFAWNIKGNNLHGTVGRYSDTVYSTIAQQFSLVPDNIYDYYVWDAATSSWKFNRRYVVGARFVSKDGDLKSPYMDEVTLGYQQKLSATMAAGIDGIYRVWKDTINDDDGQDWPNNPAADSNYHWTNLGKYREYKGVELTLRKMLGEGHFQFLASYTYSIAEGLMDDQDAAPVYGDNPYTYNNYWGKVSYDYTHVVKFNGSYLLPWGFIAGANFTFWSGPPYTTTATVRTTAGAPWGANKNFSSYYISERGADNLPDFWRLDLRVDKDFKLGPITLGFYVDIFNVTDNQEAVVIDANVGTINLENNQPGANYTVVIPNTNYGHYTQWQAPRSYFFGAKIEF